MNDYEINYTVTFYMEGETSVVRSGSTTREGDNAEEVENSFIDEWGDILESGLVDTSDIELSDVISSNLDVDEVFEEE